MCLSIVKMKNFDNILVLYHTEYFDLLKQIILIRSGMIQSYGFLGPYHFSFLLLHQIYKRMGSDSDTFYFVKEKCRI